MFCDVNILSSWLHDKEYFLFQFYFRLPPTWSGLWTRPDVSTAPTHSVTTWLYSGHSRWDHIEYLCSLLSDHNLSVVVVVVVIVVVVTLNIFFFCRTTGLISIKLGTKHSLLKSIQVCSNEGPHPFQRNCFSGERCGPWASCYLIGMAESSYWQLWEELLWEEFSVLSLHGNDSWNEVHFIQLSTCILRKNENPFYG